MVIMATGACKKTLARLSWSHVHIRTGNVTMVTRACTPWQGNPKHTCTYTPARSSGPHMYAHTGEVHDHQSHTYMYTPERYTVVRTTRACTQQRGTRPSEPHVHVHTGKVIRSTHVRTHRRDTRSSEPHVHVHPREVYGRQSHTCMYTPERYKIKIIRATRASTPRRGTRSSEPHVHVHPGEVHGRQSHTFMYTPERYTIIRATRACRPQRGTRSSEPHLHVHTGEVEGTRIHKGRWPARSHTRKSLPRKIVTSRPQWHGNDNHTRLLGRLTK